MSDYVDADMQFAPFGDDVDLTDWGQIQEEVMKEPWLDWPDSADDAEYQGQDASSQLPPADRFIPSASVYMTSAEPHSDHVTGPSVEPSDLTPSPLIARLTCPEAGCEGRSFGRRSELNRHALSHGLGPKLMCPVQYCSRTKGFLRTDKLTDHMFSGHDQEELIKCNRQHCSTYLPRDLLPLHCEKYRQIDGCRVCPMPKCSYKIFWEWKSLKLIRTHLLEKHETSGRTKFADTLARAGYAAETCDFKCPICSQGVAFETPEEFANHICRAHLRVEVCTEHRWLSNWSYWHCKGFFSLRDIPDDVRQHRRTILSIFPDFKYCNAVWEDLRCTAT